MPIAHPYNNTTGKKFTTPHYNIGENSRITDSNAFSLRGRRRHDAEVTLTQSRWSRMNCSLRRPLNSRDYTSMFASKLCSKLRKSKFVDPTVAKSSSTIIALLWSIPFSYR